MRVLVCWFSCLPLFSFFCRPLLCLGTAALSRVLIAGCTCGLRLLLAHGIAVWYCVCGAPGPCDSEDMSVVLPRWYHGWGCAVVGCGRALVCYTLELNLLAAPMPLRAVYWSIVGC